MPQQPPNSDDTPAHVARLLRAAQGKAQSNKPSALALKRALGAVTQESHANTVSHALLDNGQRTGSRLSGFAALGTLLAVIPPWWLGVEFAALPICAAFGAVAGYGAARILLRRSLRRVLGTEMDLAEQFDQLAAKYAPQLPAPAQSALSNLGQTLAKLLPQLPTARKLGSLTTDDLFFVEQLVLRYLPDALTAFAAIPAEQVEAAMLLTEQMQGLQQRLDAVAEALRQEQLRLLEQHGRFLAGKTGKRP